MSATSPSRRTGPHTSNPTDPTTQTTSRAVEVGRKKRNMISKSRPTVQITSLPSLSSSFMPKVAWCRIESSRLSRIRTTTSSLTLVYPLRSLVFHCLLKPRQFPTQLANSLSLFHSLRDSSRTRGKIYVVSIVSSPSSVSRGRLRKCTITSQIETWKFTVFDLLKALYLRGGRTIKLVSCLLFRFYAFPSTHFFLIDVSL